MVPVPGTIYELIIITGGFCTWKNIDDGAVSEAKMMEDLTEEAHHSQVQELVLLPYILSSCQHNHITEKFW